MYIHLLINRIGKNFENQTSETVFVKNECFITPFLLTHNLNDLFDLQDDLGPLDLPPTPYQQTSI